jgi:hypothetical protein
LYFPPLPLSDVCRYGGVPYEDLKPQEVQRKVREGLRLTKVPGVSDEFHKLCQTCWFHNREERPTFVELQKQLIRMLTRVCFPDTFADCIMTDLVFLSFSLSLFLSLSLSLFLSFLLFRIADMVSFPTGNRDQRLQDSRFERRAVSTIGKVARSRVSESFLVSSP